MESVVGNKKIGYLDILKEKNFLIFMIGGVISRFGDSIDSIAYGWMVYKITGSTALMAVLFGINAIPNIIFQPIAGVFTDFRKKKNILLVCNIGRAVMVTITALMFKVGILKVYHLYIFTFINSTFESFNEPAGVAAFPLIISKDKYAYASALKNTLARFAELIGLAVAAGIIAVIGLEGGMMINAASFYICAIFMFFVKFNGEVLKKEKLDIKGYGKELKEGFKYIKSRKLIFCIAMFGAALNILLIPVSTLSVAYINDNLKMGPEVVSLMSFALSLGLLTGGAVYPKIADKIKGIKLFIISGILMGLSYEGLYIVAKLLTGYIGIYIVIAIASMTLGMTVSMISMLISVSFMENVDKEFLGRAAGMMNSLMNAASPLGSFAVAGLCIFFNTPEIYFIFGIITMVIFYLQRYNKGMKEV